MEGKHNIRTDSTCLGSSSREHLWDNLIIVEMSDGQYSEIHCLNKGCYAINRVLQT